MYKLFIFISFFKNEMAQNHIKLINEFQNRTKMTIENSLIL